MTDQRQPNRPLLSIVPRPLGRFGLHGDGPFVSMRLIPGSCLRRRVASASSTASSTLSVVMLPSGRTVNAIGASVPVSEGLELHHELVSVSGHSPPVPEAVVATPSVAGHGGPSAHLDEPSLDQPPQVWVDGSPEKKCEFGGLHPHAGEVFVVEPQVGQDRAVERLGGNVEQHPHETDRPGEEQGEHDCRAAHQFRSLASTSRASHRKWYASFFATISGRGTAPMTCIMKPSLTMSFSLASFPWVIRADRWKTNLPSMSSTESRIRHPSIVAHGMSEDLTPSRVGKIFLVASRRSLTTCLTHLGSVWTCAAKESWEISFISIAHPFSFAWPRWAHCRSKSSFVMAYVENPASPCSQVANQ